MSTKPMRMDLFRFVTLRSAQSISSDKKQIGFIRFPYETGSQFLNAIENITKPKKAYEELIKQRDKFEAIAHYQDIRAISKDVYEFGFWLQQDGNKLSANEIKARAKATNSLDENQVVLVWDNLFYQLLNRQNPRVRNTCLLMLKAQHVINQIAQGNIVKRATSTITTPKFPDLPSQGEAVEQFIKKIQKAKIIVPKAFSSRRFNVETDKPEAKEIPKKAVTKEVKNFDAVNVAHNNGLIRARNDRLRSIKKDLGAAKRQVMRRRQPMDVGSIRNNSEISISPDTRLFLEKSVNDSNDIQAAIKLVGDSLRRESRRILGPQSTGRRDIMARGHLIRANPKDDEFCFSISFLLDELHIRHEAAVQRVLYMTLNAGYPGAYIQQADYRLTIESQGDISDSEIKLIKNDTNYLQFQLFPERGFQFRQNSQFTLTAELILDDGTELTINATGSTFNERTNGCAEIRSDNQGDHESEVDEVHHGDVEPTKGVRLYGVNNVGVAVFRRVEQEVCCYVPGEVSRIENILAREYKERSTRNLLRTELTEESTSELEVENMSDTATSERNELQTEVSSVLETARETGFGASLGVSGKYPGGEVTADTSINYSASNSASASDSVAKTFAEEITQKTVERVVQKSSEKRISKIIKEFEETNKHGFDNRQGENHVTGVYRWVDIIYINRLINYGKRLSYEFMIPEPAASYKHMLSIIEKKSRKDQINNLPTLIKPIDPTTAEVGMSSPDVIDEDNYSEFGRLYGVTIPAPLPFTDTTNASFTPATDPNMKDQTYSFDVFIPGEYEAVSATVDSSFQYKYSTANHNTKYFIFVGDRLMFDFDSLGKDKKDGFREANIDRDTNFANPWVTSVGVSLDVKNINTLSVGVVLDLQWKSTAIEQWQQSAFDLVMNAYQSQLDEYNAALEARQAELSAEDDTDDSNRKFNRTLETRELQRICIEMITKPFGIPQGQDFYSRGHCTAKVKQTPDLVKYASHVKFFEQAFDWEIMSYIFYPYYWADDCSWSDLLQTEYAPDPIFQAFLQSGMARVHVPVRPGFEDAVTYYMETGDIWNGGDLVLDSDDDLYISVAEELQEIEGFVEEKWESRVPTTLTVVQGDSVLLREGGLPCCDEASVAGADNTLESDPTILGEPKVSEEDKG